MTEDDRPKIIQEGQYEKRGFFNSDKLNVKPPKPPVTTDEESSKTEKEAKK